MRESKPTDSARPPAWLVRYTPAQIGIGFLLLTLVACFVPLDFGKESYVFQRISDAFHFPLFGLLTGALVYGLRPRCRTLVRAVLLASAVTIVAAAFIELVQPFFGRSQSSTDMVNGMLGTGAAALGILLYRPGSVARMLTWGVVSLVGLAAVLIPAATELVALRRQRSIMPTIADFEDRLDLQFWEPISEDAPVEKVHRVPVTAAETDSQLGRSALRIDTVSNKYSGAELRLHGMSWKGHRELVFFAASDVPSTLLVRIDDFEDCSEYDSRYNGTFDLHTGWNEIHIPIAEIEASPSGRTLTVDHLKRMLFFVEHPQGTLSLTLDQLELR
ncbi:MAG: VanZ family protein [Bdellovibrionota bacterium]